MNGFRTLVWVRWRILINSVLKVGALQSLNQILEYAGRILLLFCLGSMSLAATIPLAYAGSRWGLAPDTRPVHYVLLFLFLFWQGAPYLYDAATAKDSFDLQNFLVLPIPPARIASWNVGMAFLDPMVLFFLPGSAAFVLGAATSDLGAGIVLAGTWVAFLALNVPLFHLGATARGASRWAAGALRLGQVVAFGSLGVLATIALSSTRTRPLFEWAPWCLPSGWAAAGLGAALRGGALGTWAATLALLGALGAAAAFLDVRWAVRNAVQGRREGLSGANRKGTGLLGRLGVPILAKELTYLSRSAVVRSAIFFSVAATGGYFAMRLAFPTLGLKPLAGRTATIYLACLLLAQSQFLDRYARNHWGWDEGGVRAYLSGPVRILDVVRWKMAAAFAVCSFSLVLALVLFLVLVGSPDPRDVAFTAGGAVAVAVYHFGHGALASAWFPRAEKFAGSRKGHRPNTFEAFLGSAFRVPFYALLGGAIHLYAKSPPTGFAALGLVLAVSGGAAYGFSALAASFLERRPEFLTEAVARPPE